MAGLSLDVPLSGSVVRVEPLEERHRDGLREAAAEAPETFRFTGLGYIPFERWFDETLAAGDEVPFALIADGREVGSTRFLAISPENRRAEIGWTWLRRSAWGTGVNVETKLLLLEHAFERCGFQRVEFKTDARNLRSRGALLALGARFEGISRKHMVIPEGARDSAWYAIVDDDWPEVKARLLWRLELADAARGSIEPPGE
jgi:RimJ/RimL family protein N-acetyltransferase